MKNSQIGCLKDFRKISNLIFNEIYHTIKISERFLTNVRAIRNPQIGECTVIYRVAIIYYDDDISKLVGCKCSRGYY